VRPMPCGFEIGAVLDGRYVLLELVGEGGMGLVFRACQPALARTVAIKLLRAELADDARFVRRFHDEAVAACRAGHPGSVAVLDWGRAHGAPYLVMEDVRGPTLTQLARQEPPIPITRALALVGQLLEALGAAHEVDVVHADLKSDNVLVETTRSGDRVRLIDYGLARLVDEVPRARSGPVAISGTPEYMAPEVIEGAPPSVASDLYGVGVILYELVTGHTPFGGGGSSTIMERHVRDAVVPPSICHPARGIPPALDRVLSIALAKEASARYVDAAAFAAALAAIDGPLPLVDTSRCGCGARRRGAEQPCWACGAGEPRGAANAASPTRPLGRLQRKPAGTPVPGFGKGAPDEELAAAVVDVAVHGEAEEEVVADGEEEVVDRVDDADEVMAPRPSGARAGTGRAAVSDGVVFPVEIIDSARCASARVVSPGRQDRSAGTHR
jgi:hypothetical protein